MRKLGVILVMMVLLYGCAPAPQEAVQEAPVEEPPAVPADVAVVPEAPAEVQEQISEVPQVVEEAPPAEPVAEVQEQETFEMFNPVLTYEGAYNGPLYGTSEQVGATPANVLFDNFDRNGINYFIGMFAVFGEPKQDALVSNDNLGYIIAAAREHPKRIIPFINPGIGGEEIEDEGLLKTDLYGWYSGALSGSQSIAGRKFIRGFGEVETQEWGVRHNDPKVMELVGLASRNDISFMFHPVAAKIADVQKMIEEHPDTTFLIHMYREDLAKSMSQLIAMMKAHDNLYFSMDAAHIVHIDGDVIYEFDSSNKDSSVKKFVSYYDSKENTMVKNAIAAYKPLVDAVPDKVMWGTEIGPAYAFEPEVFDRAIKASRMVIAGFDEENREAVAYKNALRVFGEGVVVDDSISVIDTSSWAYCSSLQVSGCDEECDFDGESPEADACLVACTIKLNCIEKQDMDVG